MAIEIKEAIKAYLNEKGIYKLGRKEQLIAVVESVAEIPFGEGRTVEETLITKKVGTCSGKHTVLHACLNELGFKCRQIICTFRWDEQKIKYPQRLESILKEGSWLHGHTYLQIEVDDRWVDTDVTWNPKLKPYGFKTFPEKWNGETPFIGIDNIKRRWVGLKGKEIRTNLIESLTVETRDRRERFLKEFFKWIDSLNKT